MDGDGEVDVTDVSLLIGCVGKSPTGPARSMDVDCDGDIDACDQLRLANLVSGLDACNIPCGACCMGPLCAPAPSPEWCHESCGAFMGDGTSCGDVTCPPPIPDGGVPVVGVCTCGGDVNGDGFTNSADALLISSCASLSTVPVGTLTPLDVDCDGDIDACDADAVLDVFASEPDPCGVCDP
jgi:hypothetical protein